MQLWSDSLCSKDDVRKRRGGLNIHRKFALCEAPECFYMWVINDFHIRKQLNGVIFPDKIKENPSGL